MGAKQFIHYAVMPDLRPRLQSLFFSGFQYIPFFMALVYQTVKLLPPSHPYLNPLNIGKFGIRHVIAEAANHLTLKLRNIDQLILFAVMLVGVAIVFIEIVMLGVAFAFQPVMAAAVNTMGFDYFFQTLNPKDDLAFMMLDLVFGVPDMFNSCASLAEGCKDLRGNAINTTTGEWILRPLGWPMPIHLAMHEMFRIYSQGLLVVAMFIASYFIATVALETAQSGTPFGKRFNKLWAPLRLVVAIGLLIPLGSTGLNSSQYIVLYAAKFGSGFATNGWTRFNNTMKGSYLGKAESLISKPNVPEVGGILQFMYTASTCAWLEWLKNGEHVKAYVVRDPLNPSPQIVFADVTSVKGGPPGTGFYQSYEKIMDFIQGGSNIVVRFGVPREKSLYKGQVQPLCGEIIIPLADPRVPGAAEKGPEAMQRYYVFILQELWNNVFMGEPPNGYPISAFPFSYPSQIAATALNSCKSGVATCPDIIFPQPPAKYASVLQDFYKKDVSAALTDPSSTGIDGIIQSSTGAIQEQINSPTWEKDEAFLKKGWAAAGLWYNKVAELNGAVTESVMAVPSVSVWPEVMEYVREKKRQQDRSVSIEERFKPQLADGKDLPIREAEMKVFASALWEAFSYWQKAGYATSSHTQPTGNIFLDTINAILGTDGLYSMRRNPDVHPLAQLTGIGKSLVEASIRNLLYATAGGASAAVFDTFGLFKGVPIGAISSMMISIVTITLSAGFILYYIVPFMPFLYFFFAVGGWLKAIFEAMVGAPLWALAHIRIDGNGLPGSAAVSGYFLIFEIFLRPIMIVFGLLASISIFGALVSVLNQIWELVTANLSGFDVESEITGMGASLGNFFRSGLDEFFFTIIYTIIVYMMAMSSFKLIDLIPVNILRWMGQNVATENDSKEDAAQGLASAASVGGNQIISPLGGSMKALVGGRGG